ncbi:MAG: helix-turn-helix transcriptional regulator [Kiritimatiellae bacterium]|nr:helix-turn-helix transcriptional regulator [Kiritimatiellia bacterium]
MDIPPVASGLSPVKFASALGVSVKKVSAWEHGKAVPDEVETEKIRGMYSA